MAEVTILSIGSDSFSKSLLVDVSLSHTMMTICSQKTQYPDRSFCAPLLSLTKLDNQLSDLPNKKFFVVDTFPKHNVLVRFGDAKVKQKMKMTWSKWVIGKSKHVHHIMDCDLYPFQV